MYHSTIGQVWAIEKPDESGSQIATAVCFFLEPSVAYCFLIWFFSNALAYLQLGSPVLNRQKA